MSQLSKDIRKAIKTGTLIPAKVIDVLFGKASIRLLNNGTIYHNLRVTGGPVVVGQQVYADTSTVPPTVLATAQASAENVSLSTLGITTPDIPYIIEPSSGNGTGGGHTIQDEGIDLTQRTNLNFEGLMVHATDDNSGEPPHDASLVTLSFKVLHNGDLVGEVNGIDFWDT